MIKQIQLRGISRTPSDRMTADGGCEESLNVHLDSQEIAPTLPPVDVTTDIGHAASFYKRVVFIHKTDSAEVPILVERDEVFKIYYAIEGVEYYIFGSEDEGELITGFTSNGNTLVISTTRHTHYALYKHGSAANNRYIYLGTKRPEPKIEFMTVASPADGVYTAEVYHGGDAHRDLVHQLDQITWDKLISGTVDEEDSSWATYQQEYNMIVNGIWSSIRKLIFDNRQKGYFCAPVLVRYALRLYDGSYINQSAPALMGADGCAFLDKDATGAYKYRMTYNKPYYAPGGLEGLVVDTSLNQKRVYKIVAKFAELDDNDNPTYNIGNWKDIIQSIDIFISQDIYLPRLDGKFVSMTRTEYQQYIGGVLSLDAVPATYEEDELTKASVFYKIASFSTENLDNLVSGYTIKPISQDELFVQSTLQDDQWSHHERTALKEIKSYNNRIVMAGVSTLLYPGPQVFQSLYSKPGRVFPQDTIDPDKDYYFIFHIKDTNGDTYKVKQKMLAPVNASSPYAFGWISYPDTKCFMAELVYFDSGSYQVRAYSMKEHPNLNCSYCFLGFGEENGLLSVIPTSSETDPTDLIFNDAAVIVNKKQLMLSEVDNPFLFPIANRRSMSGDIIGIASTTMPLASYQTGRFQQYVFTSDGVFSIDVNADGSLGASSSHSREVALDGTILPTEMAIVFATKKGVMLMNDGGLIEISENMKGKHYVLETDVQNALAYSDWSGLVSIMTDTTNFMEFIKTCTPVYDYPGKRIIFFNQYELYAYIYKMDTKTWHKISMNDIFFENSINSFPEAYCSVRKASQYYVYNFSTILDDTTITQSTSINIFGAVVSRPFDLEAPDVRKVIKALRIRGNYNIGDVKYLLLGSMDGLTYGLVHSLHGNSFKSFKLVLLTKLNPTERLSWIDVDFDTRFTNRLR